MGGIGGSAGPLIFLPLPHVDEDPVAIVCICIFALQEYILSERRHTPGTIFDLGEVINALHLRYYAPLMDL